jgi:hypothetical protein
MRLRDVVLAVLAAGLLLAAGVAVGRRVERIGALAAEPAAPLRVISKAAARVTLERLDGRPARQGGRHKAQRRRGR